MQLKIESRSKILFRDNVCYLLIRKGNGTIDIDYRYGTDSKNSTFSFPYGLKITVLQEGLGKQVYKVSKAGCVKRV